MSPPPAKIYAAGQANLLRVNLGAFENSICGRPFYTSDDVLPQIKPNLPPNFDEIMRQNRDYCALLQQERKAITPVLDSGQLIEYDVSKDPKYPLASDFPYQRSRLEWDIENYNSAARDVQILEASANRFEAETTLMMFAPYLLVVALALRLTKVTGELRFDAQSPNAAPT